MRDESKSNFTVSIKFRVDNSEPVAILGESL